MSNMHKQSCFAAEQAQNGMQHLHLHIVNISHLLSIKLDLISQSLARGLNASLSLLHSGAILQEDHIISAETAQGCPKSTARKSNMYANDMDNHMQKYDNNQQDSCYSQHHQH